MDRFILFTYEISKLSQKDKMRFIRSLQGYDSIKSGNIEHKPGLLSKIHGFKFGSNTIVIPIKNKEPITNLFTEFKINTKSLIVRL